jgi:hypothetical protein
MKTLAMLAGAAILSGVVPAAAQTGNQAQPSSPCQAEPDRNGGVDAGQAGSRKPPPGDLTQKLDPCDGVLEPPPTGDSGMTEPAPDAGNTPIIRPGQVPQQAPKK